MLEGVRSFRSKLLLLLTLSSGIAVLLVCAMLVSLDFARLRASAVTQLEAQAGVVAVHSEAALSFNDPDAARETIEALRHVPEIASAALYESDGSLFAAYRSQDEPMAHFAPGDLGHRFEAGRLVLTREVERRGERLGTLVLAYDMDAVYTRLTWNIYAALAVGAAVVAVAFLVALRLQRVLATPVAELARTAAAVSRTRDYSARAAKFSDDELGRLTDGFNDMLAQIERQAADIRRGQATLSQANHELRSKNLELEQFVYTVSHDLKSPLVTINGFVGLLKEDLAAGQTGDVIESIDHLARASQRMSQLIDDLLRLSRIGRVRNEPERVDVAALLREIAHDLAPRLEEAGAELVVCPEIPPVVMDRVRLMQVFENLLTNAIKYGCPSAGCRIEVCGVREGDEVRLFVRDNGPGIAPEYHRKIFGLFQRLDNKSEGTGVGLAIVARIMEVCGGRAWVESAPGRGATFWFALPAEGCATYEAHESTAA